MKKLLLKFMSVFTAVFVVLSAAAVSVSASTDKTFSAYFDNLDASFESEYFWEQFRDKSIFGGTVNNDMIYRQYYMEVSAYGGSNNYFYTYYISFEYEPKIYYNSSDDLYYIYLNHTSGANVDFSNTMNYHTANCQFLYSNGSWKFGSSGGSFSDLKSLHTISFNEDCSIINISNMDYGDCNINVWFSWDTQFNKKDVDIKVNVDGVSDTLPTSIDITENPEFYIDIKNNTENAIQFVAWISDTPASSGAYNSYSNLNWTYSTQQWVYVYHGTWADNVRTALDIYGNVVDTADLVGIATWWKDKITDVADEELPKSYYSRDNISSPYHFVSSGDNFKEKFSFNTATISKDKEYYFNIVYREVISYEIIDGAIALLLSPFHDDFSQLDYYELGYCTAFSLTTDTVPESSTDTNIKFPSDFSTTINNTKTPSAIMDKDGNISLSGGDNDLNNSINFNPSISNSNYNGGVTINNNVGGSDGGDTGDYGDFDGDVSKLEELLNNCKNFFDFLKTAVNSLIPEEMTIVIFSCFTVIVFLRILGR